MKTMFKNKTEILGVMLVIILAIGSMPNFFYGSNHWQAYALEVTTSDITVMAATEDNCKQAVPDATGGLWVICGTSSADATPTLYRLSSTYAMLDDFILGGTLTSNHYLMGTFSSGTSGVILRDGSTGNFKKFVMSGGAITQVGTYTPSSCTVNPSMSPVFDSAGFIWFTCTTEDLIVNFNPTTMLERGRSIGLDDNVGIDCDAPDELVVDKQSSNYIVVVSCDTTNNIVTTSWTSGGAYSSILDDIAKSNAVASDGLVGDGQRNTFAFIDNVADDGLDLFTYDSTTGIITAGTLAFGDANDQECLSNQYLTDSVRSFIMCAGTDNIQIFLTNSTGWFKVGDIESANIVYPSTDYIIGFNTGDDWYFIEGFVDDGTNVAIHLVTDLTDFFGNPDTPNPDEEPNIVGGVDCSLPENENKLICRVSDDGAIGNFIIGNGTSGLTGLVCNLGVVDCANDDNPQTNGAGLLVFIASLFVVVGMFYIAMGRNAFAMPVFIWIVIILALSAFFTITGIIDPVFLILSIIAIIALAAPRLKTMFNRGTLGEGSTE